MKEGGTPLEILHRLQQIQSDSLLTLQGLFPSERHHPFGYHRQDYSAYFTATLLGSLMSISHLLEVDEAKILEEIRQKACEGVAPFQNKQGLPRYNFWQTNPGRHFPNGRLLGRWDYFRPPDDADDSVMIYLMQKRPAEDALWLSRHIDSYANGSRKWIRNTPPAYKELQAYCTFFSKDMPLGFDACVISNILYFNSFYKFEETIQFQDSVRYLVRMLTARDHWKIPQKVSPYYPHTSVILYHLARLMSDFRVEALEVFRAQIIADIGVVMAKPASDFERLILENAWLKLAGTIPPKAHQATPNKQKVYFFVLPLTVEYEGLLPQFFAHKRLTHIRFSSEAFTLALQLENLILLRNAIKPPR